MRRLLKKRGWRLLRAANALNPGPDSSPISSQSRNAGRRITGDSLANGRERILTFWTSLREVLNTSRIVSRRVSLLGADLTAAIGALPLRQRETFLLRAEGGLSLDEIAQVTGANRETAKSRLRFALIRLRHLLEPRHDE